MYTCSINSWRKKKTNIAPWTNASFFQVVLLLSQEKIAYELIFTLDADDDAAVRKVFDLLHPVLIIIKIKMIFWSSWGLKIIWN